MSAKDYTELTVAQLTAWGDTTKAALQQAIQTAEQQAAADEITTDEMMTAIQTNKAQIDDLSNKASQLDSYAQLAFSQGAGQ